MSKVKDAIGIGCAVVTAAIWVAVGCSGGEDSAPPPADDDPAVVQEETPPADPLQDEFETAWTGMDDETRASYCWALESMTPRELAEFSSEMTGQDPADWERVTLMISEKCSVE